jgi:hypothetical protein
VPYIVPGPRPFCLLRSGHLTTPFS